MRMPSTLNCPLCAASACVQERLRYVYNLVFPARWDLQRQLADKYMKLMVVRSALDLYEHLEMWDDMIECYMLMGASSRCRTVPFAA